MPSAFNPNGAHRNPSRGRLRQFLETLVLGPVAPEEPRRGRLLLESLEKRQLLAGDMEMLFTDGSDAEPETPPAETTAPPAETPALSIESQPEGELAPDLVQFAIDLADAGVEFFGAEWCPACTAQKELFQDGKDNLPFIEVTDPDARVAQLSDSSVSILNSVGEANNISVFPTWVFPDGSRVTGLQTLETLSQRANVPIPQSEDPTFETIGDQTVRQGSPLHIPVDVYDPDGGPQTVTVSVSNPSLLEATVITGNRSIRIDMEGYGDMVFEMFEQRAPRAAGRVIELANDDFYDGIIFHRIVDNFVIQGGDPTGTGTSGSSLGQFDDDFHPDLQHNREGILSFAKSSDDTNNSQFFVTEVPTRFLDFNHSIIGQLVEGFDVREAISEQSTASSRSGNPQASTKPEIDVVIDTIEVFEDTENSVVMLKALGSQTGTTDVTFTVTDQDGNTHSETITVTVIEDTATTASDAENSQPFLNEITTPDVTPVNSSATLQLTSVDIEGDAVRYTAQSLSGSNATVSVDATSGLVTVDPATDFSGVINVQVGVQRANPNSSQLNDRDTQMVSFTFEGEAVPTPTSIDLQSGSDTGSSDTDNVTNAGALAFDVTGVADGATVELINVANGTVLGTGVASGSSITINTNNIAALGDGTYTVAARQRVGSDTSGLSPSITLVYDSTAPDSVVDTALTTGNVLARYESDLISTEEGSGLIYALTDAPNGAEIDPTTGLISWRPLQDQEGSNDFTISLTDLAGNTRTESFTVEVAGEALAEVRLEVVDLQGTPISTIAAGQTFLLRMIGVDRRRGGNPGVFAAYADVLFNSELVRPEPGSTITYESTFPLVRKGTFSNGLINELGAVSSSLVPTNVAESLIATIRMEALQSGTVNIRTEPADDVNSEVLLYFNDDQIPAESVAYGSVILAIGQNFTVGTDTFTVQEDSGTTTLDVLANDQIVSGGGSLSVVSVTQPDSGGTVAVDNGTVTFTPSDNFNGQAVFTYRVSDSGGVQENGTVTVNVSAVNDPPTGVADTFNVDQDSSGNVLDVLANDEIAPDDNETLTITDVSSTTSAGGTVSVSNGGANVTYTPPAGFTGTDTFSYTVSDGVASDSVSVTVTVAPIDNPPTANDDAFTITEDDAEDSFDVLSNDTRDVDNQTFIINSVGTPSQGGSARVSADGSQFFYTPAADFAGTEEVTYTIRDTGGGLSVGTVTFTVNAVNDPPPAPDLTVNLNRSSGEETVLDVDDLQNVDSGETLTIATIDTTTAQGGTARIDAATQTILYTAATGFTGTDTINYTIDDGNGLTSSGVITVEVADFTTRDIVLNLPTTLTTSRLNGVMLVGTNLLGDSVSVPLQYTEENAVFAGLLPGDYNIQIPAVPFLLGGESPRQIPVTSAADDGDVVVEAGIGRLRPEFITIQDFLGSAPRKSLLVAVAPGETNVLGLMTSTTDTIDDPVVELDSAGQNVTIRGTTTDADTSTDVAVAATLPTTSDPRVQLRGRIDDLRLFRISVEDEDVTFDPVDDSGAEGEFIVQAASFDGTQPAAVNVPAAEPNTLSLGETQAEGEAVQATSRTDLFVPASSQVNTRTDATVLPLEEGDLWIGESTIQPEESQPATEANAIDSAMSDVTETLEIVSSAGDAVADGESSVDERAVDALLADAGETGV